MRPACVRIALVWACISMGCGRIVTDEPELDSGPADGVADSVTSIDALGDVSEADAVACPAKSSELKGPCRLGAKCAYFDRCIGPDSHFELYTCDAGGWTVSYPSCTLELGPDGCPRGGILAGLACSVVGKVCEYPYCAAGSGAVAHHVCATTDGGLFWTFEKRACPDAG